MNNASYLGEKGAIFVNPSLFFEELKLTAYRKKILILLKAICIYTKRNY